MWTWNRNVPLVYATLALIALAAPALGVEQVVKNDSIVDSGTAVIVGDFVAGEVAGARLTSPCNGTLVAVQILWLEGTAGHGQSLEEAIYIWNGNTFPTPGTELAFLEAPVMTPGFWNEFRYLDEANTIPLNVPVSAGQQFYVALQFANPTNVGNGGPSVVRDTDGCQSGKNVLYAIPGGWLNFCLFLQGDLAIRAVIDCPGATGACCHATGICESGVEQEDCQAYGDVWTQGQTCAQVSCIARGACCRQGGCLQLTQQAQCQSIGGVWAGPGTNCNDSVCVAGACCLPDTGECVQNFEFQCVALGGTFLGHGVSCGPSNPCPQPTGACCFGTFCIEGQVEADCLAAGGTWAGAGRDCRDDDSNSIPDVCEGGPAVCTGDCNCDGVVNFGDINAFVLYLSNNAQWLATYADCPAANGDIDGNGVYPSFGDINPFVTLLSTSSLPLNCP
ncbi:MAG: hypothetical protein KA383_03285 [Phycisphaerae bacterium]|nr:hypothetical protein [Phycisphaerae bacterium]